MPWTPSDAESHKKGLSESDKKKWSAIANSALEYCKKNGPPKGKTCDQYAIMTANSKTGSAKFSMKPPEIEGGDAVEFSAEIDLALDEDQPLDMTPPEVHSALKRK